MSKIIKHGIEITASLDSASKKQMKAALQDIFSDGAKIDLNTPENLRDLKAFARMFQNMFESVGNKSFDFTKIMKLPGAEMFNELKGAAKEFEDVWDAIVTKMGNNGLRNIFMKDQTELSVALDRLTNRRGNLNKREVSLMEDAFKTVKSRDINRLLEEASGLKQDFVKAETWEEQSRAALKYLNIYQRIMELTDGDSGVALEKGMKVNLKSIYEDLDTIGTYTVQQLESVKPQIQASLQNLFNLKNGKPLIGLTEGGAIDINVAPKLIQTLDVGDITGGKPTIEIPIDLDFKDQLSEFFKLVKTSTKEAAEQADRIVENMVRSLPSEKQEWAEDRLWRFAELQDPKDRNYNAIWKDFVSKGLFGDANGESKAHQDVADAINGVVQAQENLNDVEGQNPQISGDIDKKIQSYNELSEAVSRYIELAKSLVNTEKDTSDHKQIQKDMNGVYRYLPYDQQDYIDTINKQQKNISKIKSAIKAGSSTYTDMDGYEEHIVEDSLDRAESKLRGYIYSYAENFDDISALVDGATTKGLKNLIEKEVGRFKADNAIQQQQREIAEAANVAALKEMEQIEQSIMNSAPSENLTRVSETLDMLHYRADKVDRFTQSSQTDWLATNLNITSPHKEIEMNAEAINSYEELCEVVARYNELQQKRYSFTGDKESTLSADEENEFANLYGRLKNTREGVTVSWRDVEGDIDKLAQKLGIEIPQAADKAEDAINDVTDAATEMAKADARRQELIADIDKYGQDVLTSKDADDNLKKLEETYNTLKKEGLLTEELEESYNRLNQKLETRANLLRQAEGYYDDVDGVLGDTRVASIDSAEQYRKDHIKPFDDTITKMSESGLFSDTELEKFEKISKSMENRAKQLPFDEIFGMDDIYATEDLVELEGRLERIKNIMAATGEESMSMFDPQQYEEVLSLMSDIESRIDDIKESQDDELYQQMDGLNYWSDAFESSEELEEKLKKRQELMTQFNFTDTDDYKELEQVNEQIQERIALMKELEPLVQSGKLSQDDLEGIVMERGSLDERRAALEGIKLDITNLDSDADEALNDAQALLDIYEKISVVTGSGKKLELGPEMSPEDFKAFMRSDPESAKSIEFIRKAAVEADAAVEDLNDSLEQTNKLGKGDKAGADTGDASSAELKAIKEENERLRKEAADEEGRINRERMEHSEQLANARDEAEASEKRAREAEEELARIKADSDGKKLVDKDGLDGDETFTLRNELADTENALADEVGKRAGLEDKLAKSQEENEQLRKQLADVDTTPQGVKDISDADVGLETTQLQGLKEAVEAVTTAVDLKTKAFQNEEEVVGQVISGEIDALTKLKTEASEVSETISKLLDNIKTVVDISNTSKSFEINVNTSDDNEDTKKTSTKSKEDNTKKSSTKSKEDDTSSNKSGTKSLEKDYEKLGRLWARLDDDNYIMQSAMIENLEDEIKRKQESLGLTEKEIAALKEKMVIAEQAENRIIKAEQEQAAKDKKAADNLEFARSIEELGKQYEKLGKLQAQADAGDLGKAEEARQLETIIQQETEKLQLNEAQNAKILETLQLRQQEAKINQANILAEKDRQKEADRIWKEQVKATRGYNGVNAANSAVTAGSKTVANVIGDTNITSDIEAKARELKEAVRALSDLKDKVDRGIREGAEVDSDALARQTKQVQELTEEMNELMAIHKKYANAEVIDGDVASFKDLGLDEYQKQLTKFAEASVEGKLINASFIPETKELVATVKTGANAFTTYSFAVDEVSGKMKKLNQGTKQTETFFEGITRKTKELAQYALSSISIYDVWNQIRNGIQYVREIDTAMTELRKVTDETEASYDRFLKTASSTGARIGSTISDFTQATATFAKLGYNMDTASKMAESAIVYQNVGDGIESAEAAAESIISTMKGFGLEATNTMAIVDSFNEVGNRFAIDSKGIGDALMRSASAMAMAGNSMHETIGLATAANTVVQNPEKVGTALKTLSLRLRSTKAEMEAAGEETDGMADSVTKLQAQLLKLTHGKVDIMLNTGEFKNTTQILREMSAAWKEMNDFERAEALEAMGGKNQANVLAAIIQNFDIAERAIETSANAAGSALRENEKYLDSIEGKIKQFTNALQAMWSKLISSDVIKIIVDMGTSALKTVEALGLVGTALAAITLIKFVPWLLKAVAGTDTFSKALSKLLVNLVSVEGVSLAKYFASQMAAMNGMTSVAGKLGVTFKSLGKTMVQFFSTTAGKLTLMAAAVTAVVVIVEKLIVTTKEKEEAFLALNNELEENKAKLDDVTSKLKDINVQMEELSNKGPLTFTEQEELDRLKAQSDELQRQLDLQEALVKFKQKDVNNEAAEMATEYYEDTNFESGKGKSDYQEAGAIGTAIATAIIAAGVLLIPFTGGASLAASAGMSSLGVAGVAGGAAVVGAGVGYVGGGVYAESAIDVEESINSMYENRKELQEDLNKAQEKYMNDPNNKKAATQYEDAEKALASYDAKMAEHMNKMSSYYNSIDFSVYDPIVDEQKINNLRGQIDAFHDIQDKWAILTNSPDAKSNAIERIFGKNATNEIKKIKKELERTGQIGEEIDLKKIFDSTGLNEADFNAFEDRLKNMGLSIQDIEAYYTRVAEIAKNVDEINSIDTYSSTTANVSKYNDVLKQTSEILGNNTRVTQDYKDTIVGLIGSEAKVNEYFDENNTLVVKNAAGLKELIAQNVRLQKAQSQLDYYDLVEQLNATMNSTKDLDSATRNSIYTLLDQIDTVKFAMQQYQMLEDSLLGVTNAFDKFSQAKEIDSLNTYGSSYAEMVQTLYDAWYKTGQVGTEAFKAADEALIPTWVGKSLDETEKMMARYEYFKKNILSTGTMDNDSFTLDASSMGTFVNKGLKSGVFVGDATEFDLVEGMNLDKASELLGYTKTQAYALFSELDKYNVAGAELSFLSQLDDSLEGRITNITNSVEELNRQKLQLLEDGGYEKNKTAIDSINQQLAQQNQNLKSASSEAYNMWQQYSKNDVALSALSAIEDKQQQITKEGAVTLGLKWDEVQGKTIQQVYDDILAKQQKLGVPTELILEFAKDNIDKELDNLKKSLEEEGIDVNANIIWDAQDQQYEVSEKSKFSNNQELQEYVRLQNEGYAIDNYMEDGLTTTEGYLSNIEDILQNIYNYQTGQDTGQTEEPVAESKENKKSSDFSIGNIEKFFGGIGDDLGEFFTIDIPQFAETLGVTLNKFFTETIPKKWEEFWKQVEDFFGDVGQDLSTMGEIINRFFTETIPKKWEEFWSGVDQFMTEDAPYALGYMAGVVTKFFTVTLPEAFSTLIEEIGIFFTETLPQASEAAKQKITEFFTVTIPQKWNDFWDMVGEWFTENIAPTLERMKAILEQFFMVTVPQKWNEFWDSVGTFITQTIPQALAFVKQKITEFFTVTIPQKWNDCWNSVGTFISTTIPTALETIKQGVTTFFTVTVPNAINGLWSSLSGWISTKASEVWSNLTAGFNAGIGGNNKPKSSSTKRGGANRVNGTANIKGTASKNGSWGAKKTETSLVGELGPEILVRGNRWTTIGDNGAEFTDIKKGDIIFNHKQTEALLSNGHITGRGKAYASGTAYAGLWQPTSSNTSSSSNGNSSANSSSTKSTKATEDAAKAVESAAETVEDTAKTITNEAETAEDAAKTAQEKWEEMLESTKKPYEMQTEYIDNQVTYIENQIDYLKELGSGVSTSYYDALIKKEEEKIGVYMKEKDALTSILNATAAGTENWYTVANTIWDIEHAIQEATTNMVKHRKAIVETYAEAFDGLGEAFGHSIQLKEDQLSYLDTTAELIGAYNRVPDIGLRKQQIALTKAKRGIYQEELAETNAALQRLREKRDTYDPWSAEWQMYNEEIIREEARKRELEIEIQAADLDLVKIEQAIIDGFAEVFDKIGEAYGHSIQLQNDKISYLDDTAELASLYGRVASLGLRQTQIDTIRTRRGENTNQLNDKKAAVADLRKQRDAEPMWSAEWQRYNGEILREEEDIRNLEIDIQKDDIDLAKIEQAIIDGFGEIFDKVGEAYDHSLQLQSDKMSYLDGASELAEAYGRVTSLAVRNAQLDTIRTSRGENANKLAGQRQNIADLRAKRDSYDIWSAEWQRYTSEILREEAEARQTELDIQQNDIDWANIQQSIIDGFKDVFDKVGEAYSHGIQLQNDSLSYLSNVGELLELRGEPASKGLYTARMEQVQERKAWNQDQLAQQNKNVTDLRAKRDSYDEWSAEWQMYNDEILREEAGIRQIELDIQADDIEYEQIQKELEAAFIEAWDKAAEAFANKKSFFENQLGFVDSYISRLENLEINVPDEVFDKQIEIQKLINKTNGDELANNYEELETLRKELGEDHPDYIAKLLETAELEKDVYEGETRVLELQQKIFDNQIDRFNQIIDRINNTTQQMQNISSLLEREDVATEDGEWTSEGLARLGMAYQQMEYYKQASEEIAEKMAEVEEAYEKGEISEKKYYDTMQELEDEQWNMINSYEDMKDNIIDLNEARIDMIEEGINKEIEAYQELIDLKKEELDAERDLYDFKNNIKEQTKDIASLERRIASMSGSTDASTIAERTRLEKELREANAGLDDSYRDHAYSSTSDALDNEIDSYSKSSEDYLNSLRESVKETDALIQETYQQVLDNAGIVFETISVLSETYKFTIDSNIVSPWDDASASVLDLETAVSDYITNTSEAINESTSTLAEQITQPWEKGTKNAISFGTETAKAIDTTVEKALLYQEQMDGVLSEPISEALLVLDGWDDTVDGELYMAKMKALWVQKDMLENLSDPWSQAIDVVGTWDEKVDQELYAARMMALWAKEDMLENLSDPWSQALGVVGSWDTKVNEELYAARIIALATKEEMLNDLSYPWSASQDVIKSWGESVNTELYAAIERAKNAAAEINKSLNVDLPAAPEPAPTSEPQSASEQLTKINAGNATIYTDSNGNGGGKQYFSDDPIYVVVGERNGYYKVRHHTQLGISGWFKKTDVTACAKGTLGTTKDQFALTDESWIGEEITLAAGKNGQLQYLKKGSAVMPADISANLVEWGKINPNMMNITGGTNLNMISNAINKPELNLSFDSLVHVDHCDEGTLKDLEKMVDTKINQFNKQLNQSLRKFK